MEALRATYGSDSDDDSDESPPITGEGAGYSEDSRRSTNPYDGGKPLLPPPLDLLPPSNSLAFNPTSQGDRIRSFPHVEGNYALHVYIPVIIPPETRKQLALCMKRMASLAPSLYVVNADIALSEVSKDDEVLEKMLLGREFHVSLGRAVPIKVHQIDSIVTMLRQKFQSQRRYCIDFDKWAVFVNDDHTRTFLSLEVTVGGLYTIAKQIHVVDNIYRLHGLPEFYKNPRPHISLAWALGDVSYMLQQAVEELDGVHSRPKSIHKPLFVCKFSGIECKIGKKTYSICKPQD